MDQIKPDLKKIIASGFASAAVVQNIVLAATVLSLASVVDRRRTLGQP